MVICFTGDAPAAPRSCNSAAVAGSAVACFAVDATVRVVAACDVAARDMPDTAAVADPLAADDSSASRCRRGRVALAARGAHRLRRRRRHDAVQSVFSTNHAIRTLFRNCNAQNNTANNIG